MALEYLVEAREVAKANFLRNLRDGDVAGSQKYLGSLEAHRQEIVAKGDAQHVPESMRESILAHPNLARERRQGEPVPVALLDYPYRPLDREISRCLTF